MSVQISAYCDGDHRINDTEIEDKADVYCYSCYHELELRIEELESEVEGLQATVADLESEDNL
jgi:hypothetical protein